MRAGVILLAAFLLVFILPAVQATEPPFADEEAPVVVFLTPGDGDNLSWKFLVGIEATDNNTVVLLEFFVDGRLKASAVNNATNATNLSYLLQTQGLKAGAHTFTAVAYDEAGNVGKVSITVTTEKRTGPK